MSREAEEDFYLNSGDQLPNITVVNIGINDLILHREISVFLCE